MASATRKCLVDLPEELVSNITIRLGVDDKCALRLACRVLEVKSFHEFATEHFSEKCVHFTTDSLKPLVDISHSRLAKYIKEVSVVTALFSEQGFACPGRESAHWRPSVRQSEAYKFYIKDQATLRSSGQDKKMLIEAFKSLHSLKAVEFIDSETGLKPSVDYRGSRKALRQTGTRPISGLYSPTKIESPEFRKHFEHVWFTLLCSLAGAHEHLALDKLKAKFLAHQNYLSPRQFSLRQSTLQRLSNVLKNTSRLHLDLKTPLDGKPYKDSIARFVAIMPNLTHLSLSFDGLGNSGLLCRRLTSPMDLSHLTSLSIVSATIDAADLAKLITRAAKVKDLKLECIDLVKGSWPSVLKAISELESIDHLHLMYLREDGCKCFFLKQLDMDSVGGFMNDAFDNAFHHEWDDEFDASDDESADTHDDDGDSLPDLVPSDDPLVLASPITHVVEPELKLGSRGQGDVEDSKKDTGDGAKAKDDDAADDEMPDFVPSGTPLDYGGERGFYVCVEGHRLILKRLQTFIAEYNVGESITDPDIHAGFAGMGGIAIPMPPGAGGNGQAPVDVNGFNAFVTALSQGLGLPPHNPHHGPDGPPSANATQAATTATTGGATTATAAAPPTTAFTSSTTPGPSAGYQAPHVSNYDEISGEGVSFANDEVD